MKQKLITFQKFGNNEDANALAEKLTNFGIDYQIKDNSKEFDPSYSFNPLNNEYRVNIKSSDFEKANKALADYYASTLDNIDPDYYLFGFENDELKEIIRKPDEWGPLDYQLALKILKERGINIEEDTLIQIKQKRIRENARPINADSSLIALGFIFAIFTGIIGIFIGSIIWKSKKTLINGESNYFYTEEDRKIGRIIVIIGIFGLLLFLYKIIAATFNLSNF